jgi:hypothetical protein
VAIEPVHASPPILARTPYPCPMPPTWFWMQVVLAVCVIISIVIAGIKLWA